MANVRIAFFACLLTVGSGLLATACGDDRVSSDPCGDGICAEDENEALCPRDCPSACVPDTLRCLGNVRLQCSPDGQNELQFPCEPGEVCNDEQPAGADLAAYCEPSPGLGSGSGDGTGEGTGTGEGL